jgi:predicted ATPase
VADICRQLDGIPLAIELAAARARVLTPEQIAARLDDRFRLLVGGGRTAPPRQQTLRATMEWSYDLLSEPARMLFDRLSVFTGGWTLDAAEAVCGSHSLAVGGVLDVLTQLVDKSLVLADTRPEGTLRYRLLETLRQY